jgi:hypothetical protein
LLLSGRKVKASHAPVPEIGALTPKGRLTDSSLGSGEYDFLHEEVLEQDGVYEDIIAVDYKNM